MKNKVIRNSTNKNNKMFGPFNECITQTLTDLRLQQKRLNEDKVVKPI